MLRKFRTLLMVFMTLFIVLPNITDNVEAAGVDITTSHTGIVVSGGSYEATKTGGWRFWKNPGSHWDYIYVNGVVGFCVEPHVAVGSGIGYTIDDFTGSQREMINKIKFHGWDNTSKTGQDYVLTSMAIHEYVASVQSGITITGRQYVLANYNMLRNSLMEKVNSHETRSSFHNTSTSLNVGETITITDTNSVLEQATITSVPNGLIVTKNGNTLSITATAPVVNGRIQIKKYANVTANSEVAPILYAHPSAQDVVVGGNPDPINLWVNITANETKGNLEITKTDTNGNVVPDVTFEISEDQNTVLTTATTNGQGVARIDGLEQGNYFVRESAVPNHIIIDTTWKPVSIVAGTLARISAQNDIKSRIKIGKVDRITKEPLVARFGVYKGNDLLGEFTTDATTGKVIVPDLIIGDEIRIVETWVEEPYWVNPENKEVVVTVEENNTTYEVPFENEKVLGKLELEKTDTRGDTVTGAKYGLFKAGDYTLEEFGNNWTYTLDDYGNIIGIDATGDIVLSDLVIDYLVTDNDGKVTFDNLDLGRYYLLEVEAPTGYQIDPNVYEVELLYEDHNTSIVSETVVVVEELRQLSLVISKEGEENNKLNGAMFEFKDAKTKEVIGRYVTGTLYLELDPNKEVTIYDENDNEVKKVVASDKGILEEYLAEGIYSYYYDGMEEPKLFAISNGQIFVENLKYGQEVEYQEIRAPKDYVLDNNVYKLVIEADLGLYQIDVTRINSLIIVPTTGVDSSKTVWLASLAIGALALVSTVFGSKKKKKNEEIRK